MRYLDRLRFYPFLGDYAVMFIQTLLVSSFFLLSSIILVDYSVLFMSVYFLILYFVFHQFRKEDFFDVNYSKFVFGFLILSPGVIFYLLDSSNKYTVFSLISIGYFYIQSNKERAKDSYDFLNYGEHWRAASLDMERGRDLFIQGSNFRSLLYSFTASRKYKYLIKNSDTSRVSELARLHYKMSKNFFMGSLKSILLFGDVEKNVNKFNSIFDEVENKISSEKRSKSYSTSSKSTNRSKSYSYSSRSSNSNSDSTSSKNHSRSRKSKEWARNVLGISKRKVSDDYVDEAFREKVKDVHPDTGGSEEEFKKVKEARDILKSK